MPSIELQPQNLDEESAMFIMRLICNQFCQLLDEEKQASYLPEGNLFLIKTVVF